MYPGCFFLCLLLSVEISHAIPAKRQVQSTLSYIDVSVVAGENGDETHTLSNPVQSEGYMTPLPPQDTKATTLPRTPTWNNADDHWTVTPPPVNGNADSSRGSGDGNPEQPGILLHENVDLRFTITPDFRNDNTDTPKTPDFWNPDPLSPTTPDRGNSEPVLPTTPDYKDPDPHSMTTPNFRNPHSLLPAISDFRNPDLNVPTTPDSRNPVTSDDQNPDPTVPTTPDYRNGGYPSLTTPDYQSLDLFLTPREQDGNSNMNMPLDLPGDASAAERTDESSAASAIQNLNSLVFQEYTKWEGSYQTAEGQTMNTSKTCHLEVRTEEQDQQAHLSAVFKAGDAEAEEYVMEGEIEEDGVVSLKSPSGGLDPATNITMTGYLYRDVEHSLWAYKGNISTSNDRLVFTLQPQQRSRVSDEENEVARTSCGSSCDTNNNSLTWLLLLVLLGATLIGGAIYGLVRMG